MPPQLNRVPGDSKLRLPWHVRPLKPARARAASNQSEAARHDVPTSSADLPLAFVRICSLNVVFLSPNDFAILGGREFVVWAHAEDQILGCANPL